MSRRSTPERLDTARREATVSRLISAGILRGRAEAELRAWKARVTREGRRLTPDDWEAAFRDLVPPLNDGS
jgi:hypothetical protein